MKSKNAASSTKEQLKERNRGYQVKFRERCRKEISELEEHVAKACSALEAAKIRSTVLQETNKIQTSRVKVLQASLDALSALGGEQADVFLSSHDISSITHEEDHPRQHHVFGTEQAAESSKPGSVSIESLHTCVYDDESAGCSRTAKVHDYQHAVLAPAQPFRLSPIWSATEADTMQDTPPDAPRVQISYAHVAACDSDTSRICAEEGASNFDWFPAALSAYLCGTAAKLRCSPQQISWVTQFPYTLPGNHGNLSTSTDARSRPNWALSLALMQTACSVECLFLEAEHELLEASSNASTDSILRWLRLSAYEDEEAMHVEAPEQPSQQVVALLLVTCGTNESCPIDMAVKSVVHRMLHVDSALPPRLWRAACMHVVRWLQSTVRRMGAMLPNAEEVILRSLGPPSGASSTVASSGTTRQQPQQPQLSELSDGEQKALLLNSMFVVLNKLVLSEVFAALERGPEQAEVALGLCLEGVRSRIAELMGSLGLSGRMWVFNSPRAACTFIDNSLNLQAGYAPGAQSERLRIKTIQRLALSEVQTKVLGSMWRNWRRRRKVLTQQFSAFHQRTNTLLPSFEDVQTELNNVEMHDRTSAKNPLAHVAATRGASKDWDSCGGHAMSMHANSVSELLGSFLEDEQTPKNEEQQHQQDPSTGADMMFPAFSMQPAPTDPARQDSSELPLARVDRENHVCKNSHPEDSLFADLEDNDDANEDSQEGSGQVASNAAVNYFHRNTCRSIRGTSQASSDVDIENQLEQFVAGDYTQIPGLHPAEGDTDYLLNELLKAAGEALDPELDDNEALWCSKNEIGGSLIPGPKPEQHPQRQGPRTPSEPTVQRTKTFLGESGDQVRELEDAVASLVDTSRECLTLFVDNMMPPWHLSPVQYARCNVALIRWGAPRVSYLRMQETAAHEEHWKELFAPLRIFELTC